FPLSRKIQRKETGRPAVFAGRPCSLPRVYYGSVLGGWGLAAAALAAAAAVAPPVPAGAALLLPALSGFGGRGLPVGFLLSGAAGLAAAPAPAAAAAGGGGALLLLHDLLCQGGQAVGVGLPLEGLAAAAAVVAGAAVLLLLLLLFHLGL